MSETIPVAITFRLNPAHIEAIQAVDPRIRILQLPPAITARDGDPLSEAEKAAAKATLAEAEVMFGPNSIPVEYIDAAPNLRWFQVINAGVDRMAEEGLLQRGFTVTTASGLAAVAIAEWVMGMVLMLTKDFPAFLREQAAHEWKSRFAPELRGQTLGIVGMGAIGRETARRARAFEMRVVATRRTVAAGQSDPDCDLLLPFTELDTLLEQSDFVVLCVPLTEETQGMIGAEQFAKMKSSAALVNIARGQVVDQEALIAALRNGTIGAAALDVTDPEPLPPGHELWDLPNVIITPHISGAVQGYGTRATDIFLRNLRNYVSERPLDNVVDPVLAY